MLKNAKEKQLDSKQSMHQLVIDFLSTEESTADAYIVFAYSRMDAKLCKVAEIRTTDQSNINLWYELRYDRITASELYEASRCKTGEGYLCVFNTQEL